MRTEHVLTAWFSILLVGFLVWSCSVSGSGPDYKGPGIEIDVDHKKKAPKGHTRKR